MADFPGEAVEFGDDADAAFAPPPASGIDMIGTATFFDQAPPTIENIDPASGSVIQRGDSIAFDALDETALRRVFVLVEYPSGLYEVVHDGERFASNYQALSVRTEIEGGFHYVLRRATGWPAAPTFRAVAIDTGGNEDVEE